MKENKISDIKKLSTQNKVKTSKLDRFIRMHKYGHPLDIIKQSVSVDLQCKQEDPSLIPILNYIVERATNTTNTTFSNSTPSDAAITIYYSLLAKKNDPMKTIDCYVRMYKYGHPLDIIKQRLSVEMLQCKPEDPSLTSILEYIVLRATSDTTALPQSSCSTPLFDCQNKTSKLNRHILMHKGGHTLDTIKQVLSVDLQCKLEEPSLLPILNYIADRAANDTTTITSSDVGAEMYYQLLLAKKHDPINKIDRFVRMYKYGHSLDVIKQRLSVEMQCKPSDPTVAPLLEYIILKLNHLKVTRDTTPPLFQSSCNTSLFRGSKLDRYIRIRKGGHTLDTIKQILSVDLQCKQEDPSLIPILNYIAERATNDSTTITSFDVAAEMYDYLLAKKHEPKKIDCYIRMYKYGHSLDVIKQRLSVEMQCKPTDPSLLPVLEYITSHTEQHNTLSHTGVLLQVQ
eukprot:TRINITY_DN1719_c0_g1_i1.p1 TRINITY_DN1719_c0_g1~~TRINITY_DN1719_c0_g1_i1.p1  ORF type:complete len:489 (+),score=84.99 TRINITY_DN1719_c0_g1_i1:101-1468(+)